jgi:hypothetical protein
MPKFARRHGIWVCAAFVVWAPLALAGDSETSNWPCIQHKVPEISAGMMWAGPEIDEQDRTWQESPTIAPLAYRLAQRRLPIEEAVNEIDAFANKTSWNRGKQCFGKLSPPILCQLVLALLPLGYEQMKSTGHEGVDFSPESRNRLVGN